MPLNSKIDVSDIKFDLTNWFVTMIFIVFVLIVAVCCHKFGEALNVLKKHHSRQRGTPDSRSDVSGNTNW
jgi:hypothetical protein